MRDAIVAQVKEGPQVVNVMRWLSRAALEYIGRGGFGHSFGPLDDEKSTDYNNALKSIG